MVTIPLSKIVSKNQRTGRDRLLPTRTQKAEWVAEYRRSGLTMAAFARRQGLRYSSFAAWVLKSGRPADTALAPVRFAQVPWPTAPVTGESHDGLEVTLADGTRVRGRGVPALAALVRALRS